MSPKSGPGGFQRAKNNDQQRRPRDAKGRPEIQGAIFWPPGTHFGAMLGSFWSHVGAIFYIDIDIHIDIDIDTDIDTS